MSGTFEVVVRRADNLYDVGGFGDKKIDPFVKCIPSWLSKDKKTNWKATNYVDDGGTNVVFDEIKHSAKLIFQMPDKLPKPATLLVEVYDYDVVGSNDFVGSAEYDIQKLFTNKSKTLEATIQIKRKKRKKDIPAGTIFVKLEYIQPIAKARPTNKKKIPKKKKKGSKEEKVPELSPRAAKAGTKEALSILRDTLKEMDISLKEAFDSADDDGDTFDNSASYEDFSNMINVMVNDDDNVLLTKDQIQLIIQYIDSDGNGSINMEEFKSAMTRTISPGTSLDVILSSMASVWGEEENIEEHYELFDGDDSGTMSYEEFKNALITLFTPKLNLTEDNINSLTKHFDSNLDGTIQCVEFRSALQSKLVPTTTTVTTMDESTGEMIEQEINTKDIDDQQTNAEKKREQRTMPVDMSLKSGSLEIRVKRGDLIHDTSGMMDSKMDPYVRLRYKHVKSWSSTKYSSNQHKHPMWTDKENNLFTFVFDADKNSSINKPMLVIDCWDDNFGLDSLIGDGTIDLTRLLSSQPGSEKWREYKIELLHKGRAAGDIYVDMRYVTAVTEAEKKARQGEARVQIDKEMDLANTKNIDDIITDTATPSNSSFVPPGMVGIMVKSGTNLYNVSGIFDTQDPYVALIPSWLPKQQSHRTGTISNGGKNCVWSKKDSPFAHFPIEEMIGSSNGTVDTKYEVRVEVVDDNTFNDTLIGAATINLKQWIDEIGQELLKQRSIAEKKGDDISDVKIPPKPLEDVKVQLVQANGKSAGELLIGIKFSHTPGAPPSDLLGTTYSNEASTGSVQGVEKTCGSLKVTVIEAMNLKDSDWFGGESDPFVQLQLEPRASKDAKRCYDLEYGETRIKNGAGRRARFDETFTMPVYRSTTSTDGQPTSPVRGKNSKDLLRLNNRRLRLTVKDKDPRFLGLGSDDVLGTCVQDLSMVLQVGTLTSEIPLESKAGGKRLRSKIKVKTEFIPANSTNDMKLMHLKTGKIQIYVSDAKNLKNVESFLGGDQDPYASFRLIHQDEDALDNNNGPRWTSTRYINGGGKNVIYGDWIELNWTQEMVNDLQILLSSDKDNLNSIEDVVNSVLNQSKYYLQVAMWDENYPLSDKLIGSNKISLIDLLSMPSGINVQLLESQLGIDPKKRKEETEKQPKGTGTLKIAAQFVPNPDAPEIKEHTSIEKGTLKMHIIAVAGGRISNPSTQIPMNMLAVSTSIRRTAEDTAIDKKNPAVLTEYKDVKNDDDALVPCIWNQVIDVPWNSEGKPSKVATPHLHVDLMVQNGGKDHLSGKLTLPLATVTSHIDNMSGPTWLPLTQSSNSTYSCGDNVRVNVSWQYFPAVPREGIDHDQLRIHFDSLPKNVLNFDPPVVQPGKLYVKVMEAKNLPAGQLFGTSDPFPEARLLPGDEKARMHACEDGGKAPHWDWTVTPPWSFLVEDAAVASLEVSIFNEKAWISKKLTGNGLMGTCHISLPMDILSRKDPSIPTEQWMHLSMPTTNISKKKKSALPMVLVETWFEKDGIGDTVSTGWAPTTGTGRPIPFFPVPKILDIPGTIWIKPEETFDLRNVETFGFTQDPFVKVSLLCGNDKKPACVVTSDVAYDKGKRASWKTSSPLQINYTSIMGKEATNAGSTPYLSIEVWDKNSIQSNRLVGKVEVPILALLLRPCSIYSRTLILMDEDQVGIRGKLNCKLQFLPVETDDAVVSLGPFHSTAESAEPAKGGELTMSIIKAKDLITTQFMGEQDPFVRVRLSRGAYYSSDFIKKESEEKEKQKDKNDDEKKEDEYEGKFGSSIPVREAVSLTSGGKGLDGTGGGVSSYSTRAVEDGGSDPVWDEPPFVLTTWDAAFDMLRVEVVNEENKQIVGNFELPLIEILNLAPSPTTSNSVNENTSPAIVDQNNDITNVIDEKVEEGETKESPSENSAQKSITQKPIDVKEGWYPLFRCDKNKPRKRGDIRLQMRFENKELIDAAANEIIHYGPVRYLGGNGFVHVTVVGARNMRQSNKDLFVSLRLWPNDAPGQSHPSEHGWNRRTDIDERSGKGEDPQWNQSYVIPISWKPGDEKPPIINFELKKKVTMGGGLIGSSILDIAPFILFPNQPTSMYLPLGKDGRDGELLINVQFVHVDEIEISKKKPIPPFQRSIMKTISTCNHKGTIDLSINKARNLDVVQWQIFGKQDPFVKVKIHGGSLGSKGITTETRTKKNGGTNAVWMEQLQVALDDTVLPPGTSSTPLMEFQVYDKNDTHASTKIGTCIIPMFPFQMNDGHTGENWFPIRSGSGKNTKLTGEIHVASQWLPEGMLAGASGPKLSGDRPLYIHIIGARGLPQVKSLEKQDPFVTVEILDQDVQVSTSPAIDQAHSPSWNAYMPLPMSDTEFSGESPTVVVTIKDKGTMSNTFIAKCEFSLPDDVLSPPYKKLELKNFPLLDKKGNSTTGTIWMQMSREPFEGMEGRDDGIGRGDGQKTFLEEIGEDEDDDGLADGRLHVEFISVNRVPNELKDFKNRGIKLKVQLNPPGKNRMSRICSPDELPSTDSSYDASTSSYTFSKDTKGLGEGSCMNSIVLPHTINDDGKGAVVTGESLMTVWLIEPKKGLFGKDTIVASGSINQKILKKLIDNNNSMKLKVPLKSGNFEVGESEAVLKLQYIPALSGRLRIIVKQARNLTNVARMGVQDPICTLILGNHGTVRTEEATDGGNRPKWKNQQRYISYTNAVQNKPDELKVILKNNGFAGKTIGVCTIPIQPLISTLGNESVAWYTLKSESKGRPAGEIEISLLFTKDTGDEKNVVHATVEEEEDNENETKHLQKGVENDKEYKPSKNSILRHEKEVKKKQKQLDAGARLKLLKSLFYKIDTNGDKEVDQEELANMLESIHTEYDILEIFLREKCGLTQSTDGDDENDNDGEKNEPPKILTSSVILNAIDTDGDEKITWDEWCRFLGDGHQDFDPNSIVHIPVDAPPSAIEKKFQDLNKIKLAQDTSKAQEDARKREKEKREKEHEDLLNAQKRAHELQLEREALEMQRKLKELEDEKVRMAKERKRLAKLQDNKAETDKRNADKLLELQKKNEIALERMRLENLKREEERKKKDKKSKKRKKKQQKLIGKRIPRPPDNMVSHWRPYHVVEWLNDVVDLGQYSSAFEASSVDGLLLVSLSDKDMRTTLGIRLRLHRAKIGVHVRRLAELSGLDVEPWNSGNVKTKRKMKKIGGTTVEWGDNGGAANPAAPELLRMQMEKLTNRRKKAMKKTDKEDAVHGGYWAFEYDNPRNAEVVTQADAWDFDDDWADQFGDDDAFDNGRDDIDDEYDRPADEEEFRNVMKNVWTADAERAQMNGYSNDALNAFGSTGGANAAYDAADDPFTLVTKFAGENNMSFYQALQTPEIKRLRLRLKTGHSVYSAASDAIKCRQLPPEYWFKSEAPWWMTLKQGDGVSGKELHSKLVKARKIPQHATTEEVLTTVRQAVLEYGRYLHQQKTQELDPESLAMDLEEKHKRISAMRTRQGLPSIEPLSVEEDRLLSDAYQAMSRMQNNTTIDVGKSGSWTGTHNKLNRLKFQGAVKVLLKLNMNWQQFDAAFRAISTNADGTIQEDEFVAAFRSSAELADLLKNAHQKDVIGDASRSGGKRRRLLKAKGYHGIGAKEGDTDAQQIHDALDAILSTLEDSKLNLREAFESFDRSSNGSISIAEFSSLIKTLGGLGLSKRQIYRLASSMDGDFDRTVRYNEFMEYFLVIWVERLRSLRRRANRPDKSIPEAEAKKKMIQAKRRLKKAERSIKITFGSGFQAAAANAGAVLPGAFSALTRKMNMETTMIQSTFVPMSPTGRARVERARNTVITGSAAPPKSPLLSRTTRSNQPSEQSSEEGWGSKIGKKSDTKAPEDLIREGRVNVASSKVTIAGKQTLQRYKLGKSSEKLRGVENGPVVKDYGKHGKREIGVPTKHDAFGEFPSNFVPSDAF